MKPSSWVVDSSLKEIRINEEKEEKNDHLKNSKNFKKIMKIFSSGV